MDTSRAELPAADPRHPDPDDPTGTSLHGLVTHVTTVEPGYLGDCAGRPSGIEPPWDTEEGQAAPTGTPPPRSPAPSWSSSAAAPGPHADILRELGDGAAGRDHDEVGDAAWCSTLVARAQAAADAFR